MKTDQTRALSVIRLSVETDETTSPGPQRAANEGAAAFIDAEIIGLLGPVAKVDPGAPCHYLRGNGTELSMLARMVISPRQLDADAGSE